MLITMSILINTKNFVRLIRLLLVALTFFMSCDKNKSDIGDNDPIILSSATTAPSSSLTKTSLLLTTSSITRIVSFAPNITEILYVLGLGDNVCGVTQFCKYPPGAAQKEKIGGQFDRNYEAVVRLKPDLAVILKEQRDMIAFFDKYAIRYVIVGSDSVNEILESIQSVADACSVSDRGRAIVEDLRRRIGPLSANIYGYNAFEVDNGNNMDNAVNNNYKTVNSNKPKVLLCVSRNGVANGAIGKCFVAGATSFYDQLIDAAGGINVMKGIKQAYPTITTEAIIRLAPDVIIDISMSYTDNQQTRKVCGDWKTLKNVPAVKNDRVYCLSGDYLSIPGPRIGLILEDFKNAVCQR